MSLKEEITTAIGAHGLWKGRLKDAIHSGKSDVSAHTVRQDNQCKFGQWLYGAGIPASVKTSPEYRECVALHAKFHEAAAQVLELALAGKKREAEIAMNGNGDFATLSHQLTDAMMRWRNVIG